MPDLIWTEQAAPEGLRRAFAIPLTITDGKPAQFEKPMLEGNLRDSRCFVRLEQRLAHTLEPHPQDRLIRRTAARMLECLFERAHADTDRFGDFLNPDGVLQVRVNPGLGLSNLDFTSLRWRAIIMHLLNAIHQDGLQHPVGVLGGLAPSVQQRPCPAGL